MTYPAWSYFPRNVRPPAWAASFVEVVGAAGAKISTVEHKTGLSSDDVLKELGPGLVALGYAVESGKTKAARIFRPVLFGENGAPEVNYEIDAFHDQLGIAVEVEAGRGAAGNADYRDIVRTSLILDAHNMLCLCRCVTARHPGSVNTPYLLTNAPAPSSVQSTRPGRLKPPFDGVLLIAY